MVAYGQISSSRPDEEQSALQGWRDRPHLRAQGRYDPGIRRPGLPLLALLASTALLLGTSSSGVAATRSGTPGTEPVEPLAVVNAGGGTFRMTSNGYRLTLESVTPRAVWFSDRPLRDVGAYTIAEITDVFFDDDPPNAALEVFRGRGAGDVVIVEASNPRYHAGRGRLVLGIQVLGEEDIRASSFRSYADRAQMDVPARFGPAALFIDDATPCTATFDQTRGLIDSRNDISCETAQAVLAAADEQHPTPTGAAQYDYEFAVLLETWQISDHLDQAFVSRTDHDVHQGFTWISCSEFRC